ncbi:MAG: hypothetical protein ACYDA9_03210 [Terriglobia bacterium]
MAMAIVGAGLIFAPTRRLARKFFDSLRIERVQSVNVNLSSFVGPEANHSLQQMVSQMISDQVKVTINEKSQPAANAASASLLAGFQVQLLGARKDAPDLVVRGEHAFDLTVDRSRLQAILKEAGRPDLALPGAINGATIAVKIPRTVRARYGTCPGRPSATANIATPTPTSMQYSDCVVLSEGPSPEVDVPPGLDLGKVTEIGLELVGMTPEQAQRFLQTVTWKSMLGVPIPRFMRSYEAAKVNGVEGTLLNMAGRRGPTYTLVWAKNGMVYSLVGFGDSASAVTLANSVH